MQDNKVIQTKRFLSGNEAIARGAYEAGVRVAASYPGTPATEILETLAAYDGIYAEWSSNEKVAVEVAQGASFAGVRAIACMKHVGLNVAADTLFSAAYTGVQGGLVIVTADDPSIHSSQNEQDSRNYAFAAKVPMLEPSDPSEAKEFTKIAFKLSEQFDIPVLLRTTTRVSHCKAIVVEGAIDSAVPDAALTTHPEKYVMLPSTARERRVDLEARMDGLKDYADTSALNVVERGDSSIGFITAGISYLFVKETFPDASVLKLGMVYPFPEKLIQEFAASVNELYIVEELDPFIELHVKAMGIRCEGKKMLPSHGELDPHTIRMALNGKDGASTFDPVRVPVRPPSLCPGCRYRGLFYVLSRLGVYVAGDIGCYTLGYFQPLSAIDSTICMGASIGNAHGIEKALDNNANVVAVIGDSTFVHAGIPALINAVYNKGISTIVILDNRTTAMTGHQPNPVTGTTLSGEATAAIDLEALCRGIGIRNIYTIRDRIDETFKLIQRELARPEPSVLIAEHPCVLLPEEKSRERPVHTILTDTCTGCRDCLDLGCPAIEWVTDDGQTDKDRARDKRNGYARINAVLCYGCTQCAQVCSQGAIVDHG